MPITHGQCGKSWSGIGRAHCSACHETFSTYRVSDRHRIGTYGVDRRCTDPAAVGLVLRDGIWGGPPPDASLWRMRPAHSQD